MKVLPIDLSSPESIRAATQDFPARYGPLHALIHTAAVFSSTRKVTPQGWELMFATNHLGPFLLTRLLLDMLDHTEPLRILTVTAPSTTPVDFEDPQGQTRFRALWAFGATKMCNLLFTYELARHYAGSGITANAFHPGLVRSGLMREAPPPLRLLTNLMSGPPDKAAGALVSLVTAPRYGSVSGKFFKGEEEIQSNAYSLDPGNQSELWQISSNLLSLPA